MPIHRNIEYNSTASDNCADCTAEPTLAVTIENGTNPTGPNELIFKHGGVEIVSLDLIWSNGAAAPFSLIGSYATTVDPRIQEANLGHTNHYQPTGGGLIWSRTTSTFTLTFYPLDANGSEESEGLWLFNGSNQPPLKLKVHVKRKTSFSCP